MPEAVVVTDGSEPPQRRLRKDWPRRLLNELLALFVALLFTPVYVWAATPFIRPFRLSRIFGTYVVPIVPITCWWDGLV